jgi:hypothetical protein
MARIIGRKFDGTLIYDITSTVLLIESTIETAIPEALAEVKLNDLLPPDGPVNFAQQEATSLIIENRTSDPSSPVEGQIWLRTDL